jgi:O-antigen/teichoic acid export membrane protein
LSFEQTKFLPMISWVKKLISRFRSSEFAKDTAVLTLGTIAAQLVTVAAMPIMSRLYAPADFGVLAVFLAVSSIVGTAITLRYETSILLPKDESEAISLVLLSLALTLVLGLVVGITAWLLPEKIRVMLGVSVLGGWLPIAVLAGVATAVVAIGAAWFNRQRAYIKMTYLRITQSGVGAVCGIALGIYGYTTGLFMAQIISLLVLTAVVMFSLRAMCVQWSEPAMRNVAMKHSAAPKYLLPTAFLDVVTLQLPVLLITARFSSEAAGQFSMAWKILALPMALIGGAVGQVFFQRISGDIHFGMHLVRHRYMKVSVLLGMVAIVPTFLTAIYGQEIFTFVLGKQWGVSGKMAELLVFATTMYFIFSPTTSILLVLGKQKVLLIFSIVQLAYRFGVALISNDVMDYIQWLVICEFINVVLFELTIVYFLNREKVGAATW